uniref:Uncharacterized protein n=1 Tax=Panstrongylus lignarius TaxID=156445 RepID=A0A224XS60_9HEMI
MFCLNIHLHFLLHHSVGYAFSLLPEMALLSKDLLIRMNLAQECRMLQFHPLTNIIPLLLFVYMILIVFLLLSLCIGNLLLKQQSD